MKLYIEELIKDLYRNVRSQIELQNRLTDILKGNLIIKKRYNINYYYLSYRQEDKVKTDYLGKLSEDRIKEIQEQIDERKRLKRQLKDLKQEESKLRKIILAIDPFAFRQEVYDVMDLIVILRPILAYGKVKEAYLFGSYARNEMDENSDINIELMGSKKDKIDLEKRISKATNKEVNIIFAEDKMNSRKRAIIDEEKILIYGE